MEAKNSEIKHRHGYDVATLVGLFGMQMLGANSFEIERIGAFLIFKTTIN